MLDTSCIQKIFFFGIRCYVTTRFSERVISYRQDGAVGFISAQLAAFGRLKRLSKVCSRETTINQLSRPSCFQSHHLKCLKNLCVTGHANIEFQNTWKNPDNVSKAGIFFSILLSIFSKRNASQINRVETVLFFYIL